MPAPPPGSIGAPPAPIAAPPRGAAWPLALALVAAVCLPACGREGGDPREASAAGSGAAAPLDVDPADLDFSANPGLRERLRSDPHAYFRFVNAPFSRLVCDRFAARPAAVAGGDERRLASLHGDAHVEQYAVTDLGRGLTDFDDSSRGPVELDLLRFGASLRIAARRNGWEERQEEMQAALLAGYRAGLRDPEHEAPEPSFVRRLRAEFRRDRAGHLEWAGSLMEPLPPEAEIEVRGAVRTLAGSIVAPERFASRDWLEPVRVGRLRLGVGSGLDAKYLVRLRGPTADPADDEVLELKQVRNLEGIPCIRAERDDPLRVLRGEARLAYRPFRLLGYVRLRDGYYWTHAWVPDYVEVDADGTLRSPRELAELAFDVGTQLGLGHFKLTAEPLAAELRAEHLRMLDRRGAELAEASRFLAEETLRAWRRFVDATGGIG